MQSSIAVAALGDCGYYGVPAMPIFNDSAHAGRLCVRGPPPQATQAIEARVPRDADIHLQTDVDAARVASSPA
jgi:hypothetical protein